MCKLINLTEEQLKKDFDYSGYEIDRRYAVRAIVLKNDTILLIETMYGDLKFPGGGLENEEDIEQCLKRELLEETGYEMIKMKKLFCKTVEKRKCIFKENTIFEMNSLYYLCDISDIKKPRQLSKSEIKLNFQNKIINIHSAVEQNGKIVLKGFNKKFTWVEREYEVLKLVKDEFFS